MKPLSSCIIIGTLFANLAGQAQGTFVYDQQSSTGETPQAYGSGGTIQQMVAQSFTPSLSSIDFLRLKVNDNNPSNNLGATLSLNLRMNSFNGPILDSTAPVTLPDSFTGTANFFFNSSVALTPGVIYYFEPVVQSGDTWNIDGHELNYSGGMAFYQGLPFSGSDLWFREGILVPEPTSVSLILLPIGIFVWRKRIWQNP